MAASPTDTPAAQKPGGTEQPSAPPPGDAVGLTVGVGVGVALVALFAWALIRQRGRRRAELAGPAARKALEPRRERLPEAPASEPATAPARRKAAEPAPPSEGTRQAQRAAEEARRAAQAAEEARLEAKRLVEQARGKADAEGAARAEEARGAAAKARAEAEVAKARAQEEQRRSREAEEERKRAEYRARREREAQEKEERRLEAERRRQAEEEELRRKAEAEAEAKRRAEEEQRRKVAAQAGKTLAEGLAKTRGGFMASLNAFLGRAKVLDESILGELEEVLFAADIGVKTATGLLEFARQKVKARDLADAEKLKAAIRGEIERIVTLEDGAAAAAPGPRVIMVVGVNGSGKTTTIGKLAAQRVAEGRKVLLAAGDTFRAAATEQLEIWGQRAGAPVVKGKEGSDPGAVIFDALKRGQAEGCDLVLCDTAGRLHTKAPLMEELRRVKRVMDKALPGAPHETLLVLDSTNGQNAIAQAREFHASLGVSGIVLTKLDGTAKGGVVIGICDELKVPVRYVGIGEAVGDLKPFDPHEFVQALFE